MSSHKSNSYVKRGPIRRVGARRAARTLCVLYRGVRTVDFIQSLFAALLFLLGVLHSCPAESAVLPAEYRFLTAYQSYSDVYQVSAAWHLRAPLGTRASRTDVSAGVISGNESLIPFVSAGPVWQLNDAGQPVFVEFGFAPTLLGGSTLGDEDFGGVFHFTSSLVIGRSFGRNRNYVALLRIQHVSNGGLNNTNPGLDLLGIGFSGEFGRAYERW